MTGRKSIWVWGTAIVALTALAFCLSYQPGNAADPKAVKPEQLLPANSVLYVGGLDSASYQAAYEKTAAHEAFYKSGLVPALSKLLDGIVKQIPQPQVTEVYKALGIIMDKGISLAISTPADGSNPVPSLTIVVHEGGSLDETLTQIAKAAAEDSEIKVNETKKGKRTIHSIIFPNTPELEFAWWPEGKHFMMLVGVKAIDGALEVADGKQPNITTNPLWKKYRETPADPEQTLATVLWLDIPAITKTYGKISIPNPEKKAITVGDILEVIGLNELGTFAIQSGYKGKTVWTVMSLDYNGDKAAAKAPALISLSDLPPVPKNATTIVAGTYDLGGLYDGVISRVRTAAKKLGPPKAIDEVDETLKGLPDLLGFDPKADLFDTLGNVYCVYQDDGIIGGSPLGLFSGLGMLSGSGVMLSTRDSARLQKTLNSLLERIPKNAEVMVERNKVRGREVVTIRFKEAPIGISFVCDKNWLIVSFDLQAIHAALLRIDGKLDSWKPTDQHKEAFAELPQKFSSIAITDPRATFRFISSFLPLLVGGVETLTNNVPFIPIRLTVSQVDLPPAELVVKPMFPNVTVSVNGVEGWKSISRESVSMNANGALVGVGAAGIGAALLLPAVQGARGAARATQSRNNLKMIGLGAHNFASTYNYFPPRDGDEKRQKLKPKERISWEADLLPYMEQNNVYDGLDAGKPWNDDANKRSASAQIQGYLNPSMNPDPTKDGYGVTHYVGNGGVGEDGPNLDVKNAKAGAFGFNRKTRMQDFKDGLSNTVMAAGIYKDAGPWVANTSATIRPLIKKPYILGPDGIGNQGRRKDGTFLMSDGSVRNVSADVDPSVLEAIYTINGGEANNGDF